MMSLRADQYEALGRACEANGLGWYDESGEMRFQPPIDAVQAANSAWKRAFNDLHEALKEIVDPIPYARARSTTGHLLEGSTETVAYLRAIAQSALHREDPPVAAKQEA